MMRFQLDYSDLKKIVLEAVVIVCFSIAIGLAFNYQLLMRAFEGQIVSPQVSGRTPLVAALPVPVTLTEVRSASEALLVDARISEFYAAGHLPNAVSLPLDDIDSQLAPFRAEIPPNRSLIIYCSGYGCPDSYDLGLVLIENGYHDVMVYEGGFPEWRDAGLPVEAGGR